VVFADNDLGRGRDSHRSCVRWTAIRHRRTCRWAADWCVICLPPLHFYLFHTIGTGVNDKILGFHARDPESFARAVHDVITMPEEERVAIRERARQWATTRFSQEAFERGWTESGWAKWL